LISLAIQSEKFCHELSATLFDDRFVGVEFLLIAIVGAPTHPFWLWGKFPFVRIEIGNQSRFNLGFASMSAIVPIQKLGSVGDLSAPSLPAAETSGARRFPQNRDGAGHYCVADFLKIDDQVIAAVRENVTDDFARIDDGVVEDR
jgi:hypothetical protein